ncbi:hypothetical protein FNV43_RR09855 [Rhamnella rubrinervis]|uniref:Uncharacterized protein n=1 Tax=Rhamnella rubrinervis TaxID=2594499 RepID=A0A8K0HC40_9ROSA|nr:hypothetical protein FNV43_RR09855 [Rhamnella rubrinervis]
MASIISRNTNSLRSLCFHTHSMPVAFAVTTARRRRSPTSPTSFSTSIGEASSGKEDKSGESHQSSDSGKSVRGGPVSWLSFLLLVATGAGIVLYYDKEKKRHIEVLQGSKRRTGVGKGAIGGPFNLINHDGKNVTEKDFLGKWTVMYSRFHSLSRYLPRRATKKSGIEIVPVFISVDPERDTVEQVGEYVKAEEDSDYLVDHSIVMYLMGPDMQFVKFFGKNNDADSLADGIIKEIKSYKK